MHDVIVIGAGFAGCSAAREVRRAGLKPLVLEARDRIGGRTWTSDWDGQRFERGGNYFHWFQPHLWTEVTAAGVTPIAPPLGDTVHWTVNEQIRTGTRDQREAINESAWNKYNAGSWEILPEPHAPLRHPDRIARLDAMTIQQRTDKPDLPADLRGLLMRDCEGVARGHLDHSGAP